MNAMPSVIERERQLCAADPELYVHIRGTIDQYGRHVCDATRQLDDQAMQQRRQQATTIYSRRTTVFAPHIAARLHSYFGTRVIAERQPDFIVGADNPGGAYLLRWFLCPWRRLQTRLREKAEIACTPRNRAIARAVGWLPNLYLHEFRRDDDDRAHHDHPSWAVSLVLHRGYFEHRILAGGIHERRWIPAGSLRFLSTRHTHRIELPRDAAGKPVPCRTLFLFGPTVREWGFHCPLRGWVHWKQFTATGKPGEVGPGCDA